MTYPELNGTLVANNTAELFVYANLVTDGWFGLMITVSFFVVVLLGSLFMQLRMSGRIKPEVSFLASFFATFGWAIILEQYSGILNPIYFYWIVSGLILSLMWTAFSSKEN